MKEGITQALERAQNLMNSSKRVNLGAVPGAEMPHRVFDAVEVRPAAGSVEKSLETFLKMHDLQSSAVVEAEVSEAMIRRMDNSPVIQ